MGVVHGIRSFLPIMVEQDSEAHIVKTASLAGLIASGGAPNVTAKRDGHGRAAPFTVEFVDSGMSFAQQKWTRSTAPLPFDAKFGW